MIRYKMSIFYDVVCETLVSLFIGGDWLRCLGDIIGLVTLGGG